MQNILFNVRIPEKGGRFSDQIVILTPSYWYITHLPNALCYFLAYGKGIEYATDKCISQELQFKVITLNTLEYKGIVNRLILGQTRITFGHIVV